ncbi:MAG: acyl-CoA dehydrogenase [Deltaproteobacteria bacterium CG_4_8_14_3_um_filter_43_13]|nr:MAG: acyl-CoA dehydrogenase [Deltaproteobacteria bacterium CG_4_8_14_3_um_filter_43_13]
MDFRFSPEEERFREEVRQFLDTEVTDEMIEEVERGTEIGIGPHCWELMRRMGKRRWLAPAFPEEYGGMGATRWQQFVLSDEMTYHRAYPLHLCGVGIVGPTLLQYGSEEQKQKYMPPIARGEIEFALGYTEPEAGSDLANLQVKAEKKRDFYVVNGQKVFNTGCHFSQYVWLAARTDPSASKHKGISLLIVDMKTPGITVRPLWVMDGERSNEVFYDDVKVPAGNLVGEENRGFYYILTALAHERSFPVGNLRRTFEDFVDYVKEEGLGKDPLVQQSIAQLATELQALCLLCYRVTWLIQRDTSPHWEAPMVKVYMTEFMGRFSDTAMEIMGPYGQLQAGSKWVPLKGRIEKLYRHAARRNISAGTSEIQRNTIATVGLKLPR